MSKRPQREATKNVRLGGYAVDLPSSDDEEFQPKKPKQLDKIIKPTKVKGQECRFYWKALELKGATRNGNSIGNGVFAKRNLKVGEIVLNLGKEITAEEIDPWSDDRASHSIPRGENDGFIDGKPIPENYPVDGVAFFGLSLANQMNEPPADTKPNCVFRFKHVVVMRPVAKGEELTVFYGDGGETPYNRSNYATPYVVSEATRWTHQSLFEWKVSKKVDQEYQKWKRTMEQCIKKQQDAEEKNEESSSSDDVIVLDTSSDEEDVAKQSQSQQEFLAEMKRSALGFLENTFWTCSACSHVNYKDRDKCLQCGRQK
jgi:hypothetical protein